MKAFLFALGLTVFSIGASAHPASPGAFIELAKKVRDGVVNISMTKNAPDMAYPFPGFAPFRQIPNKTSGSGFIVD